jgi:plasmid stabilization system protein ParE
MSYVFLPDAQEEFEQAIGNYDLIDSRLADRFDLAVDDVVSAIFVNPTLWRERRGGYRRVNCRKFPYYIAYVVRGQTIVIVAVAHARRKPEYWKDRLR